MITWANVLIMLPFNFINKNLICRVDFGRIDSGRVVPNPEDIPT
jgi:hypothetical protein